MLEVYGKEADEMQYYLFHIFMDCREILNCIIQYRFLISEENWNKVDKIYDGFDNLLVATLSSMHYEIVVGTIKLIDTNRNSISINKLFEYCWKLENEDLKQVIKKYRKLLKPYNKLLDNLQEIRNKIYAHSDFSFNTTKVDKFGDNLLSFKDLEDLEMYLKIIIDACLEINSGHKGGELGINHIPLYK